MQGKRFATPSIWTQSQSLIGTGHNKLPAGWLSGNDPQTHLRGPDCRPPPLHIVDQRTQKTAHKYSNTYNHISHVVLYFRFMLLNTPLSHLRQSHQKPPNTQIHTQTQTPTPHTHKKHDTHIRMPSRHIPAHRHTPPPHSIPNIHTSYPRGSISNIRYIHIYTAYACRVATNSRQLWPVKKISRKARARFVLALNHTNTHIYFV